MRLCRVTAKRNTSTRLSPAGLYQGELDSVAQPVEDDRDQTLDRRLRGHCTCSFKGVEAKRRQFVRRYITSDGTDVLGLGEQATDDVDQPLLGSGDVLGLVDERAEFRPMALNTGLRSCVAFLR